MIDCNCGNLQERTELLFDMLNEMKGENYLHFSTLAALTRPNFEAKFRVGCRLASVKVTWFVRRKFGEIDNGSCLSITWFRIPDSGRTPLKRKSRVAEDGRARRVNKWRGAHAQSSSAVFGREGKWPKGNWAVGMFYTWITTTKRPIKRANTGKGEVKVKLLPLPLQLVKKQKFVLLPVTISHSLRICSCAFTTRRVLWPLCAFVETIQLIRNCCNINAVLPIGSVRIVGRGPCP